ncbi:MAG TPA: peptidoglycan DD-metalloendopeptidase family protein [Bacteroidales bacterium]|nr:peptidoglycan DD-metalloendopeptidase family protein [Bacteroidales bacterium]HRS19115.1 peptidoglycan DD-metalloendopeptidase family protein [Bacteroidales bacterium]
MKKLLIIFFVCVCTGSVMAQKNIDKLKAEAEKAKKEIEITTRLLKETEKNKNASVEKLNILNQQIQSRQKYLQSLQNEISDLERGIGSASAQIRTLNAQLEELQKEYNQTLFTLYKVRSSYDQFIFILSAENYNQAYNRLKYLQYYSDYMIKQAQRIEQLQDSIQRRMIGMQELVNKKQTVVGIQKQETQKLSNDKHQENLIVQELTAKQQELKKKIEEKRAQAKKLDNQIQEAIRAEIRAAEARAKAKAKAEAEAKAKADAEAAKLNKTSTTTTVKPTTSAATPVVPTLTPEESIISKNFADNRGRLPWPTASGKITERFGTHPHPTLGFEVESNGIEITTNKGAKARAVFEGTVTKIVVIPGRNTAIIIKHGNYYSVYDNLINVQVKTGDNVKVKDELGTVFTDPETGYTVLQLQIWKELQKLDPELWLSK